MIPGTAEYSCRADRSGRAQRSFAGVFAKDTCIFWRYFTMPDISIRHSIRGIFFSEAETAAIRNFFWIDVARLRQAGDIRRAVIVDLHTFFRDMLLPYSEVQRLVQFYLDAVGTLHFESTDEVMNELVNFKRRASSKKVYKISCD